VAAGLLATAFGLNPTVLAGGALTLISGLLAAPWITGTAPRRPAPPPQASTRRSR
jgi:hypothetical protein